MSCDAQLTANPLAMSTTDLADRFTTGLPDLQLVDRDRSRRRFRLRRTATHALIGFGFGYVVVHPITMFVFDWMGVFPQGEPLVLCLDWLSRSFAPEMVPMGLVFGLSEIILRMLHGIFVRKLLPKTSRSIGKIDLSLLREMLAYGINTFLYAMGAIIIYNASILVIGIFMSTSHVSQFTVASAGVFLLSQILQAFTAAIKPAVSDLDARNDHIRVKEIAFLTQKYSLLLLFPGGCFLVIMGREFLNIWVSDQFRDPVVINEMAVVLTILTVGHCLMLAQHSNFLVLVGRGEHKIFGILTALTAIFCVLASVLSVKVLNWGLRGIAWSNFLPMALTSVLILPIYFNRKMHISMLENIRSVWRPALLGSLPAVAMIYIWKYASAPDSWFEIIAVVVAAMVLILIGGWLLSLNQIEKERFIKMAIPGKQNGQD